MSAQHVFNLIPRLDAGWATLLAGIRALIAGILAYRAAYLTIREERRNRLDERESKILNLYIKAQCVAHLFYGPNLNIRTNAAKISFCSVSEVGGFTIKRPADLDELWTNLSYFPADVIDAIRCIYVAFEEVQRKLDDQGNNQPQLGIEISKLYVQMFNAAEKINQALSNSKRMKAYGYIIPEKYLTNPLI